MRTAISIKGQVVLPSELRRQDGIEAGEQFEIERIDRGVYRLTRLAPTHNQGLVEWLLSCPEKGFFVPLDSGSTDAGVEIVDPFEPLG